jgi:putative ABC transport system substrate-binding protein
MMQAPTQALGRRHLIVGLAAAPLARPIAARALQPAPAVIGVLHGVSAAQWKDRMSGLHQGLSQAGLVEGRNLTIESRWAEGHFDRLPGMAEDLVRRNVAVICAGAGDVAIKAAMMATNTIPIVFTTASDPVRRDRVIMCPMSALSHKRTWQSGGTMSALPPSADILSTADTSAKCQDYVANKN